MTGKVLRWTATLDPDVLEEILRGDGNGTWSTDYVLAQIPLDVQRGITKAMTPPLDVAAFLAEF
jgi:hypothetical protein